MSVGVGVCARAHGWMCVHVTWVDVSTCASGSQMSRLGISSGLPSAFDLDWASH